LPIRSANTVNDFIKYIMLYNRYNNPIEIHKRGG
jgi:hypothetical protein